MARLEAVGASAPEADRDGGSVVVSEPSASTLDEIAMSSIKIGARARKALGDLDGLAASIQANGLLHPLVITPTRELIAGERRCSQWRSWVGRRCRCG